MHSVTGLFASGVLSPLPENPAAQGPVHGTFIYDEFASGGGMGGGGSRVSEDQYVTPTPAQEIRFGLRRVLRGVSGAYDDLIGLNDPPDEAFFRGGSAHRRRRGRRVATQAASPPRPDRSRIEEDLRGLRQALEEEEARAEKYRQRAEEYAPAALDAIQLRKQLRRLEELHRQALLENGTLHRACADAVTALENAREALENANARAEENAEQAHELPEAIELSRQFATVAGMEQKLRVRAEKQAQEQAHVIDSVKAGVAQLSQAISSLQRKVKAAGLQSESAKGHCDEQRNRELGDLQEQLATQQAEIEKLKSQLRDDKALKADMETLRGKLASSKAAEQAARADASKQRKAAEAARAQGQEKERLSGEIERLRRLLENAQGGEARAKEEASRSREVAGRAVAEALNQTEKAAREKVRADKNERLANEASWLGQRVQVLEERGRKIGEVLGRRGLSDSPRPSHRVVSMDPELAEAFETLELEPTVSREEFDERRRTLTLIYHPDRFEGVKGETRALAESKMKAVNKAVGVLDDHFRRQESSVIEQDCA